VPTANELLVVRRTLCADEFVTLRRSVQRMSLGLKEPRMRQVTSSPSMSLDGYIARNDNTIGQLFDWLQNGDVEVPTVDDRITFHMSPTSAAYWRSWMDGIGALVCGRTLFDFTAGWGGQHTMGVPWSC